MKVGQTACYLDFLKQSENRHDLGLLKVAELLKEFGQESSNNNIFGSIFFVTDYIKNHNFFHKSEIDGFLGFKADYFVNACKSVLITNRHAEDMQIFDNQIFTDEMTFLSLHKQDRNVEYSFTSNFRVKNITNSWCSVVQRTIYIFNEFYKMPIASLNWITDVTNFMSDSKICHLIERYNDIKGRTLLQRKCYFLKNTQELLSKREMDVLKLASKGMASKEIADCLNISIHTINNHRRNMLERSNCKNILQLVDIAIKSGVI